MEEKKIEGGMRSWRRRRRRSRRRRRGKEGGSRVTFPSYQLPCLYLSSPAGLVISVKPVKLSLWKAPTICFGVHSNPGKGIFRTNFGPVKLLVKATSSHFHFVQINKLNSDFSDHTVFNVSRYLVLVDSIVRKDESIWFKIYPMFPRSWRHCIGCIGLIGTVWMINLICIDCLSSPNESSKWPLKWKTDWVSILPAKEMA